jgi:hypothetical protein
MTSITKYPPCFCKKFNIKEKTMSSALHFPSHSTIVSYLENHPLTSNPYLKEKGIIEAAARAFADQSKVPMGIQMGVMLTMHDLNEKIKLPQVTMMTIHMNLTQALEDCARGNEINLEKK